MRLRPALLLAAPVGVLGGHAIGYLAAPGPAAAGALHHGYLALVLAIAVPLGALAMAWAAMVGASAGVRSPVTPPRPLPIGALLLAQWVLFTGQEVAEHTLAGHGPVAALHSPALWWGLAAQVVTAFAVALLLRASAATGAWLATLSGACRAEILRRQPWRPAPLSIRPSPALVAPRSARAPPAVRFRLRDHEADNLHESEEPWSYPAPCGWVPSSSWSPASG
jgi:hypothetical protein